MIGICASFACAPSLAAVVFDVSVEPQKYAASPGDLFPVTYTIRWEGTESLALLPPTLPPLDWGEARILEIRGRQEPNFREIRMMVGYRSEKAGAFEVAGFPLKLYPAVEGAENAPMPIDEQASAHVLETAAVRVVFRNPFMRASWAAILAAGLLVLALAAWLAYKRRNSRRPESAQSPIEQIRDLMHQARRHRLDGQFYEYYRTLDRILGVWHAVSADLPEAAPLASRIRKRLDDTGYRGIRPTDTELDGDFHDMERLIGRIAAQYNEQEN